MTVKDLAERLFRSNVHAARQLFVADLYKVEEEWLRKVALFNHLGLSEHSIRPYIEQGFRRFLDVGRCFPTKVLNPVEWAKGKTTSVLKKRLGEYRASLVPLMESLRFLDVLAAEQTLSEPLPKAEVSIALGVPGAEQTLRGAKAELPAVVEQKLEVADLGRVEVTASDGYRSINCGGTSYSLTKLAGKIVEVLYEAHIEGRSLSGDEIRNKTDCRKIWDAFRRRDGRKFWSAHITKSDRDMFTLRLVQPYLDAESPALPVKSP